MWCVFSFIFAARFVFACVACMLPVALVVPWLIYMSLGEYIAQLRIQLLKFISIIDKVYLPVGRRVELFT